MTHRKDMPPAEPYPHLRGKRVCVTGRLSGIGTRAEVERYIRERGGEFHSTVRSRTTHLVKGVMLRTSISQKEWDAKEKGVPVITPDEFMDMARGVEFVTKEEADHLFGRELGRFDDVEIGAPIDKRAVRTTIEEADEAWENLDI